MEVEIEGRGLVDVGECRQYQEDCKEDKDLKKRRERMEDIGPGLEGTLSELVCRCM